jgi:hypothetical protein
MHKSVLPTCRPASIFMFLSLAFGSIFIFANPPLRGPDEIAHFLRIYSYARGELLPVTEINSDSFEQFDPLWKLLYMWEHPYHFPLAAWTALSGWADRLWQELIGIVGWQDILLPLWTYLVLTVLLLAPIQKLQLDGAVRARVAVITGLVVLGTLSSCI